MHGSLLVWKIEPRPSDFVLPKEKPITDESAQFTIPPNKENWQRSGVPMRHDTDINVLAFSPCSQFVCTASMDDLYMFTVRGSEFMLPFFFFFMECLQLPNGVKGMRAT